jgi:NAD(P)-dependent dehydrogenase (short-subunit alcohol dehydrogenase family)
MRLDGTVAIVTGAAGGMGGGITRRFAREGAHVVCVDPAERVGELGRAEGLVQDVRDLDGMERLVDDVVARHGRTWNARA